MRFALRSLKNRPGFALTAILTLTVALAATVSMFSVLRSVLLRPLPVQQQERLVLLTRHEPRTGAPAGFGYADLMALDRSSRSFLSVAGVMNEGPWPYVARIGDRGVFVRATVVSAGFFQVLGSRPSLGRLFQASDAAERVEPAAVISYGLWRRQFGADSGSLGRRLLLVGAGTWSIVGVAPRGFDYPGRAEVWIAHRSVPNPTHQQETIPFNLIARLKPPAGIAAARVEASTWQRQREAADSAGTWRGVQVRVTPFLTAVVGNLRESLAILSGAVALVLLIANVNLAGLLLISGSQRARELGIRGALGATRRRIGAQLFTEAAVIAGTSGLLGTLAAYGMVAVIRALAPADIPRIAELAVDGNVLLFALAVTGCSTLLLGFTPVIWSYHTPLFDALRQSARVGYSSRWSAAVRRALVAAQVAAAVVVLCGAGLLVQSLLRLRGAELGFDSAGLTLVDVSLAGSGYEDMPRRLALFDQLAATLEQRPGIASATMVTTDPFTGDDGWRALVSHEGQSSHEATRGGSVDFESVAPSYFRTLGIPLLRGRGFTPADRNGAPYTVVLSKSLAERHWPGQDPLGKRVRFGLPDDSSAAWRTVVGVVGDNRFRELERVRPIAYIPFAQYTRSWVIAPQKLAIRSTLTPGALLEVVRRAVREVASDAPVVEARPFARLLEPSLARPRFNTMLLLAFALIAVILATVGLYALLATFVQQRMHEIGVRVALGARPVHIRRLVLGQGLALTGIGIALGLLGAWTANRLLRTLLYEVAPTDPLTFGSVALLFLVTAALACYVPMRRATRLDPLEVMRAE